MIINDTIFNASLFEILTELKSQLNANNIDLLKDIKDSSDNIMITCPYHKNGTERRPSGGIKKNDGVFHCFTCGEVHSLPELISYCFGKYDDTLGNFGWNWLLKNFATVSVENRKDIELNISRDITKSTTNYVSEEELDKYRYYHPYMYKRGLNDEIINLFDIGYDKDSNCITFPVREINGKTLFVARRSVCSKFFNYPSSVEKPVYGLYELSIQKTYPKEVIICESMLDALKCWVFGKYAVALNGLGTEYQFRQLNSMPCRKFILATDNDSAGKRARTVLRNKLKNKLITEYILPPNRKDMNELTYEEFMNLEEVF